MSEYGDDDYYGSGYYGYDESGDPMPNTDCIPQLHICALRVSELESDGVPLPGAGNLMTVNSIVELTITPNVVAGDEVQEKNGCGAICLDYIGDDSVTRYDIGIKVCDRNPYVLAALGRGDVLTNSGIHGYAVPPLGSIPSDKVSIEFWAKRIDDGLLHADYPYAWWVLPLVTNLREGDITKNSGSDLPSFVGRAYENANWYNGPLNDWPVTSDRAVQWFPTPTLPTTSCTPGTIPVS